ncbi:hypothetical protein P280DRAFT_533222 [Massarina eburnea CBS 473.64]|uniref:Myb-like domain-containing protein n=1 Tax=Massarina eburnea CBS 473.64 TaxID=1395130 RepID=A0A6A6RQU7_9PLEO|nr:hypothetical protein P280DRAFT_533222 [Massarina eburnea CBS 473.64]
MGSPKETPNPDPSGSSIRANNPSSRPKKAQDSGPKPRKPHSSRDPWTPTEDVILMKSRARGDTWNRTLALLPGRSITSSQQHFYRMEAHLSRDKKRPPPKKAVKFSFKDIVGKANKKADKISEVTKKDVVAANVAVRGILHLKDFTPPANIPLD